MLRVLAVLAMVVCFSASLVHSEERVSVSGSSTVQPILLAAAKAFKVSHPNVDIVIGGGGSSKGIEAVGTGKVQIGASSRALNDDDKKKFADLVPVSIGLDGIAMIVNAQNPVAKITKQQVQDIYTGKITNWKEIGGGDAAISLVCKTEGHGTLEVFQNYFGLESKEQGEGAEKSTLHKKKGTEEYSKVPAKPTNPSQDTIAAVLSNPNAIAYLSMGTAQAQVDKGGKLKLLDLDGVAAKIENVSNETYPLRRPLLVVSKGAPQGMAKEFIDFLLTPEVQKIVVNLEYISVAK